MNELSIKQANVKTMRANAKKLGANAKETRGNAELKSNTGTKFWQCLVFSRFI